MKKIVSILILSIVVFFCVPLHVFASYNSNIEYGNIDYQHNSTVDIMDATLIQMYLAQMKTFDEVQTESADYDHDGEITVLDITFLQRFLCGINIHENFGGSFKFMSSVTHLYADYESGKAQVGVPVTFTADEGREYDPKSQPIEYRFEIYSYTDKSSPIVVRDYSQDKTFTFTFESANTLYEIYVYSRNRYGYIGNMWISSYKVIEPNNTNDLKITSVYTDQYGNKELYYYGFFRTSMYFKNMSFYAIAKGGSGDYQYAFEYQKKDEVLTQEYSYDNSFTIPRADIPGWEENDTLPDDYGWVFQADNYDWRSIAPYKLTVKVRDSNGLETSETYLVAAIEDFGSMG